MLNIHGHIMIIGPLFGAAERNARECIYGQQNIDKLWGGLLVMTYLGKKSAPAH